MRRALALALTSMAIAGAPSAAATRPAPPAAVQQHLPQVIGPIAVTAQSRPFLGMQAQLDAVGYVEEEYFLAGTSSVYDWDGPDHKVKVVAGPGKYVTRILVMRPRYAAKFSGNVEVTILNASLGADHGSPSDFARMTQQGDVWIGITSKPITVRALKKFDPVRYAPLDWSNPAPVESRCATPSIIPTYMIGSKEVLAAMAKAGLQGSWPETEDGLIWDMLGQLGQLLKIDQRQQILPGFGKPWVYMTGVSQSAIYIRLWAAGFETRFRTPDNKPVYDGYFAVVGPSMPRINQCAADVPLDDPSQKLKPSEVPFVSLSSEGEMWQARYTRQPDAFTRHGGLVSYEVAGASHSRIDVPGLVPDQLTMAPPEDMARAGVRLPPAAKPQAVDGVWPNNFVWAPLVRGAYHNLQLWVRGGVRPPQAPGIAIDASNAVARDAHGNAIGGVRMPYIDVPVATHTGFTSAGGLGGITGTMKPFPPGLLRTLYIDQANYAAKFDAATATLVAGHWIWAADAAAMKAAVAAAPLEGLKAN